MRELAGAEAVQLAVVLCVVQQYSNSVGGFLVCSVDCSVWWARVWDVWKLQILIEIYLKS